MHWKAAALCGLNAMCWAAAPLIGKLSNANAKVMAVMISVGSLVAVLPMAFTQNYSAVGNKGLLVALAAGIINGIGVIVFYQLIFGLEQGYWEISKIIPIVFVLVPVVAVIGSRLVFAEEITIEKIIGVGLACAAIWLLKK